MAGTTNLDRSLVVAGAALNLAWFIPMSVLYAAAGVRRVDPFIVGVGVAMTIAGFGFGAFAAIHVFRSYRNDHRSRQRRH